MTDRREGGPLSSEELERDRSKAGTSLADAAEAGGDSGPASEQELAGKAGERDDRPNPIAGTMLPPD